MPQSPGWESPTCRRLVRVLDDRRPEPLTLSAVYPQHRQASRLVQVFIEFLRERLDSSAGVIGAPRAIRYCAWQTPLCPH